MPDFVKVPLVKQAMAQVAAALNAGKLPPDVQAAVLDALGEGLVSEGLAERIAKAINPYIDIPLLNEEQEEELLKKVIAFLLVQREDSNVFLGVAQGSAKLATVQGAQAISVLSGLRTKQRREMLAQRLTQENAIPFLDKNLQYQAVSAAVDSLAGLVLSRVPPGALESALAAGEEEQVEEFLTELLAGDTNIPLVSQDQKRSMARCVVKGWLSLVDKDALKQEQAEEESQRASRLRQTREISARASAFGKDLLGGLKASAAMASEGFQRARPWASQAAQGLQDLWKNPAVPLALGAGGGGSAGSGGGRGSSGGGGGGRGFFGSGPASGDDPDSPWRWRWTRGRAALVLSAGLLLALAGISLARRRMKRQRHARRLPAVSFPQVIHHGELPVSPLWVAAVVVGLLVLFLVTRLVDGILSAALGEEPRFAEELNFPEVSWDAGKTSVDLPLHLVVGVIAVAALALVPLLRLLRWCCCRWCCRRRPRPAPAAAVPLPGSPVWKPTPSNTAPSPPPAAEQAGVRGAVGVTSSSELSPSQQVRELLGWLEEAGAPHALAESVAAAALFTNRLHAHAHGASAAPDVTRGHGLVVCAYEALPAVLAWQREQGGRCERCRGIPATVRELFNWPQLQLSLRGAPGSGLLLKPSGELWAVLGKVPMDEGRPFSEDRCPWHALAKAHPDNVVVLVCQQARAGQGGRGLVTVLHGNKQWRLPPLTQPPRGEEWPDSALATALQRAAYTQARSVRR
uniref:Uncharacterized protein n=1 Tax=Alexandrium monilatum TaxID=311494 RepID=A0A7S4Q9Q4_9DINO